MLDVSFLCFLWQSHQFTYTPLVKLTLYRITRNYSCDEYEARLETCKKYLCHINLDDLYRNKDIVGNVLDEDYKPEITLGTSRRSVKALISSRRSSKIDPDVDVSESSNIG